MQEGDRDDDGISIAADALSLNGGAIRAADGTTDADLSHGAVAARRGHKVNGALASPPVVNSIVFFNPARSDTYELGETVALGVEFHRAVTVTGSPRLALIIGAQTRHAAYSTSWGDGRFLHFSYAVQEGDRDEDGIAIPANALALNGGTITDADGTAAADLAHAAESPGQHGGKVDGSLVTVPVVETISLISFPARGDTYELGEMVEVVVEFDGAVKATGEPQVALTIGTQTRYATYNGWGRDSLYFSYAVQAGDHDEDGISIAANALVLDGGSITATDGTTDADLTHAAVTPVAGGKVNGSRAVTPPRVRGVSLVSAPARGDTYQLGETVEVVVEFDGAVKATGDPQLALTIGTQSRYATFFGWGSDALYFNYTVQVGDRDADGIGIPADALVLSGGTITAADGITDADLTHAPVAAERGAKVNGNDVTPPRVREIRFAYSPARGDTYERGETVEVEVEFDRAVRATGDPQVELIIGTQTRYATFWGWGSETLYFEYIVQEGDRDEDGIGILANALVLNGGTITAVDGTTDANLRHDALAGGHGRKVDGSLTTPPGVREIYFVSSPARGDTYELGETIEVMVEFDRVVRVTGSPRVALTIGAQTRHAAYSEWWGDDRHAHFSYTVPEDDRDERGIRIPANALMLNGGTITAVAGTTDADLTHPAVAGAPVLKVNGSLVSAPAVSAIYLDNHVPPPTGDTYVLGETVRVWVEFDKEITVSGSPRVALTIGGKTRQANYSGFSVAVMPDGGTIVDKGVLSFDYRVQATDRDEDGVGIPANALALNGGTIKHAGDGTTDADLTHDAVPADPTRKVDGSRIAP